MGGEVTSGGRDGMGRGGKCTEDSIEFDEGPKGSFRGSPDSGLVMAVPWCVSSCNGISSSFLLITEHTLRSQ